MKSPVSGSMGVEILPLVLETIANEPDDEGAWFHLWGLMELAAKADDTQIREQVIWACTELLQKADRAEIEPISAINAAWTLAFMKHTDSAGLLRRLKDKSEKSYCHGDYADALSLLEGYLHEALPANLWEQPVKEWFEPRWRMARDWYAKEAEQNDEDEIDIGLRRAEDLAKRFLKSSEAAQLTGELLEDEESANRSDFEGFSPPIPIVEPSPKVGRNDPCPCGSGRKYKKCCGGVKKAGAES